MEDTCTTRWKVLWESTTPRERLPNGAAYMGPFCHLGTSHSPIVGTINHHHACDAQNVNNRRFTEFFNRYFHIPLPIVTKHELGLPFPLGTFP